MKTNRLLLRGASIRGPVAVLLASCLALGAACGGKEKAKKPNKVVEVFNFKEQWDKITSKGEEGKFFCRQGLSNVQAATTPEGRDAGYLEMVKGLQILREWSKKGEELIRTAEEKKPGSSYPEWEETLSDWTEYASKVRKNLPMEYIEELNRG